MAKKQKTPPEKQPNRPHFIPHWAIRAGYNQAQLAKLIDANPGVVSKWFKDSSPGQEYQKKLANLFGIPREAIFQDPDVYWAIRHMKDRDPAEIELMKQSWELHFPRKTG